MFCYFRSYFDTFLLIQKRVYTNSCYTYLVVIITNILVTLCWPCLHYIFCSLLEELAQAVWGPIMVNMDLIIYFVALKSCLLEVLAQAEWGPIMVNMDLIHSPITR